VSQIRWYPRKEFDYWEKKMTIIKLIHWRGKRENLKYSSCVTSRWYPRKEFDYWERKMTEIKLIHWRGRKGCVCVCVCVCVCQRVCVRVHALCRSMVCCRFYPLFSLMNNHAELLWKYSRIHTLLMYYFYMNLAEEHSWYTWRHKAEFFGMDDLLRSS